MKTLIISFLGLSIVFSNAQDFIPKNGFVPDEKTAIAIAVAVWSPIYGAEQIQSEKPFTAVLKGGVWHVEGTLPKGTAGGVATADISQKDARIIRVIHTQ